MKEKECEHNWKFGGFDNYVPPFDKICIKCGSKWSKSDYVPDDYEAETYGDV